jgi:hypothetical protein
MCDHRRGESTRKASLALDDGRDCSDRGCDDGGIGDSKTTPGSLSFEEWRGPGNPGKGFQGLGLRHPYPPDPLRYAIRFHELLS